MNVDINFRDHSQGNFYAQDITELINQSIQLKKKTKELSKKYLFNHENTYATISNWLFVHFSFH